MSFYDDASLIMYPSGYKASKIYSLKPTDGTGDLTFTRASTATRVNSEGLIESVATGVPRIDYTGGGCGKLLLEPQRTNLALYSEQIDNAYWLKYQCSITANQAISPDGTQNADLFTATASGDNVIYRSGLVTRVLSYFVKAGTLSAGTKFYIAVDGVGSAKWNQDGTINSQTGGTAINGISYQNGWYRFTFVVGGGSVANFGLSNSTSGDTLFVYGIQAEEGSYVSSYIPTLASSVTRLADAAFKTGISSLIGQTQGVLFIDFVWNQLTGTGAYPRIIEAWNNSSNYIQLFNVAGTSTVYYEISNGGAIQFSGNTTMNLGRNKLALAYKLNDCVFYKNGSLIASDTSATIPTTNDLGICGTYDGTVGAQLSASVNQAIVFPTRLTNTQLASLTTI